MFSFLAISSLNANPNKPNEEQIKKKFFDFNDYILDLLDDIINKNVIDRIDKMCVQQLNMWRGSILNGDKWAMTGTILLILKNS